MQPTLPAPEQQRSTLVPRPRGELRTGSYNGPYPATRARPYPGPYALPYQGPDRPFPERGPRAAVPLPVRLTAWLGVASGVALAVAVAGMALGGLAPAEGPDWPLALLVLVPLGHVWGAVDLLVGRTRRVLAAAGATGCALAVWLLLEAFTPGGVLEPGWWLACLLGPPLTLVATTLPPVRSRVAARAQPSALRRPAEPVL